MNKQFLDLMKAKPSEKVTLVTNSTPPKACFICFDNNGNPLTLQFQQRTYDFLKFDNINRESNPRALFAAFDDEDTVRRIEINFFGEMPPNFTLVERKNWESLPEGGINAYCGSWVAETSCLIQRV